MLFNIKAEKIMFLWRKKNRKSVGILFLDLKILNIIFERSIKNSFLLKTFRHSIIFFCYHPTIIGLKSEKKMNRERMFVVFGFLSLHLQYK